MASTSEKTSILSEIEESINISTSRPKLVHEDVLSFCDERDFLISAESLQQAAQYGIDARFRKLLTPVVPNSSSTLSSSASSLASPISIVVPVLTTTFTTHEEAYLDEQFEVFLSVLEQDDIVIEEDEDVSDLSPKDKVLLLRVPRSTFEPLMNSLKNSNRSALRQTLLQQQLLGGQSTSMKTSSAAETLNKKRHPKKSKRKGSGDFSKTDAGSSHQSGSTPGAGGDRSGKKSRRQFRHADEPSEIMPMPSSPPFQQQHAALSAVIGKAIAEGSTVSYLIAIAVLCTSDVEGRKLPVSVANIISALFDKDKLQHRDSGENKHVRKTEYLVNPYRAYTRDYSLDRASVSRPPATPNDEKNNDNIQSEDASNDEELLARAMVLSIEGAGPSSQAATVAVVESPGTAPGSSPHSAQSSHQVERLATYGSFFTSEMLKKLESDAVSAESESGMPVQTVMVALLTVLSASSDSATGSDSAPLQQQNRSSTASPPQVAGPLLAALPVIPEVITFLLIDFLLDAFVLQFRDHSKTKPETVTEAILRKEFLFHSHVDVSRVDEWNTRNDFLVWTIGVLLRLLRANFKAITNADINAASVGLGMIADTTDISFSIPMNRPFVLRLLQKVSECTGLDPFFVGEYESRLHATLRSTSYASSSDILNGHFIKMNGIDAFVAGLGMFRPIAEERQKLVRYLLQHTHTSSESKLISQSLSPYALRPVSEAELCEMLPEKVVDYQGGPGQPQCGYYELVLLQKICFAVANSELALVNRHRLYAYDGNEGDSLSSVGSNIITNRSSKQSDRIETPISLLESPESFAFSSGFKAPTLSLTTKKDASESPPDVADHFSPPTAIPIESCVKTEEHHLPLEFLLMKRLGQDGIIAHQDRATDICMCMCAGELALLSSIQQKHLNVFASCMSDVPVKNHEVKYNSRKCHPKIDLSDEFRVATHKGHKHWVSVSSLKGISVGTGVYEWSITLDKCEGGQVFIGLVTADASMDSYIGSDRFGWGVTGTKSLWHDKTQMSNNYGPGFGSKDVIYVRYDSDHMVLSFSGASGEWGVAFTNLPRVTLFAAVSLYNTEDKISLHPAEPTAPNSASNGTNMVLCDAVAKTIVVQASTVLFAQALLDRADAILKRAETASLELRHDILNHPFISLMIPSLAASLVSVKLKHAATAYPSVQLLPYLTIITKRLAALRDSLGGRIVIEKTLSRELPNILGNIEGSWIMRSSAVGGTIPAQEYALDMSYNDDSALDPEDSKFGVKIVGTGLGGSMYNMELQGTQNGTRLKFLETWAMGGSSVVEGRVSICGSYFVGHFKDAKSDKGGSIYGTRIWRNEQALGPADTSSSTLYKTALLCAMACGKLSTNLIRGLNAIHANMNSDLRTSSSETIASGLGIDGDVEDSKSLTVEQTELRERWVKSDLFSGGLPFDSTLINFLSDELKFNFMLPASDFRPAANLWVSTEEQRNQNDFLLAPKSDAEIIDPHHNSRGWLSWWLSVVFPLLYSDMHHPPNASQLQEGSYEPLGPSDASIPFSSASALSMSSGRVVDEYVVQHIGHSVLSKLGGEDMQSARKGVLAALVKHSGCVSLCKAEGEALSTGKKTESDRPSPPLLDIWRATQRVIEQTIRQKQASGQSYSALSKALSTKCELLQTVQANPVCCAVSDSLALLTADSSSDDIWTSEAGKNIQQDCAKLIPEVVEFLLSPLMDISALKHEMTKSSFVAMTRSAGFRAMIMLFNKIDRAPASIGKLPVLSSVPLQSAAAVYVMLGLNSLSDLSTNAQPSTSGTTGTQPVNAAALSSPSAKPVSSSYGHYMDGLYGLNFQLAADLKTSFEQTYDIVTQILSRSTWAGHRDGQCIALTCWGIRINPSEHIFLNRTGIFKILQTVLDDARTSMAALTGSSAVGERASQLKESFGPYAVDMNLSTMKRLSQLALKIVHSLASQVAYSNDPITSISPTSAPRLQKMPSGPDTLSQSLFDMLYAELFSGIKNMLRQSNAAASAEESRAAAETAREDLLEGDQYMYRILRLLYIVSNSKVCQRSLCSPKWLSLLIAGIGSGELGVQRRILRLLRRMLVHLNPANLVAFIPTLFSSHDEIAMADGPLDDEDFSELICEPEASSELLMGLFFEGVSVLVPPILSDSRLESNLLQRLHKAGITKSLSAESLVALRVLQGVPAWRKVLDSVMLKFLSFDWDSPGAAKNQWGNVNKLLSIASALAVNGGYIDRLRLGGIVTIRPFSLLGTAETFATRLAAASHSCGMLVAQSASIAEVVVMERGTRQIPAAPSAASGGSSGENILQHTTSLAGTLPVRAMRINSADIMPSPDVPTVPDFVSPAIFEGMVNILTHFAVPWIHSRPVHNTDGTRLRPSGEASSQQSNAEPGASPSRSLEDASEDEDDISVDSDDDDEDEDDENERDEQQELLRDSDSSPSPPVDANQLVKPDNAESAIDISDLENLQTLVSVSAFRAAATALQNDQLANALLEKDAIVLLELLKIAEMETTSGGLSVLEAIEVRWAALWDAYNSMLLAPPTTTTDNRDDDPPPSIHEPSRTFVVSRDSDRSADIRSPLLEAAVAANVFSGLAVPRAVDPASQQAAVAQMVDMGLPPEWCEVALRRCRYNIEMAINLCFENADNMPQIVAEDALAQSQATRDFGLAGQVRRTMARLGGPIPIVFGAPRESRGSRAGRGGQQQEVLASLTRQLNDMGFPPAWCARALDASNNDVDAALSWILSHGEELSAEDEGVVAPPMEESEVSNDAHVELVNPLVCISGSCDVKSDLSCATNISGGFPSVGCRGYSVTKGKWYFEVLLQTAGCVQIGWVDSAYEGGFDQGRGVGDDEHSWAYDGWRMYLWHEFSADWGARWAPGDVVGCAVDMDNFTLSFFLNGFGEEIGMGVGFTNFKSSGGLYPAASFNRNEKVQFNLGGKPFAHSPPQGYRPYIEHVNAALQTNTLLLNIIKFQSMKHHKKSDSSSSNSAATVYRDAIEDGFDEEKGDKDYSWHRRYFQPDEQKSGFSERLPKPPLANLPSSIPIGNRNKLLKQFSEVSKDLCILYCRMSVMHILSAIPRVPAATVESGMINSLLQAKAASDSGDETTSYLDALFLVLRLCSAPSNRTKIYLMTMSTLPSTLALPHNLGSILSTGGLPMLGELQRAFATLLARSRSAGHAQFVEQILDTIAFDTFNAANRSLQSEWRVDTGFVPVVYRDTVSSDASALEHPSLGMAVWMTKILTEQLALEVSACLGEVPSQVSVDINSWLNRLTQCWNFTLRAANLSVKMCGIRMLSIILQDTMIPSGRFSRLLNELPGKLSDHLDLDRLENYALKRLEKERMTSPIYSEYLQSILDLAATVRSLMVGHIELSESKAAENSEMNTMSSLQDQLFVESNGSDYDWEAVRGRTFAEGSWETWSGTVIQQQIPGISMMSRRQANQERHDSPPELLKGCRVCRPAPIPPSPPPPPLPPAVTANMQTDSPTQPRSPIDDDPPLASSDPSSPSPSPPAEGREMTSDSTPPSSNIFEQLLSADSPPVASRKVELVEQFGTCVDLCSWGNDAPGTGRVILWDDGSTETIQWNTHSGVFDVVHIKMDKGKIVKRYPHPASHLAKSILTNFGFQNTFGVILRIRRLCRTSVDEVGVVSRIIGVMEWPDFCGEVLVNGFKWDDGHWSLTEEKLLSGPEHASWSVRFGSPCWRPGTTYEFIESNRAGDCSDPHKTHMCGNFSYDVNIGSAVYTVAGDVSVQRSRLFTFDTKMRGAAIQLSKDKLCVTKSPGGAGCVFGNVGFSSGVHYWEIKVEHSDHASIYIGVAEKPGLPGIPDLSKCSRRIGCGIINNRTSYRAPNSQHPNERNAIYGDQFLPGDTVGVLLDMNRGRLSFFLDGLKYGVHNIADLGEAFDNLTNSNCVKPRTLFPIVFLQKTHDRVVITPRWLSSIGTRTLDELDTHSKAWGLLNSWSIERKSSSMPSQSNLWIYRYGWREWLRWRTGRYVRVRTRCKSLPVLLDRSPVACVEASLRLGLHHAFFRGDRIVFHKSCGRLLETKEEAVILGAHDGRLWYRHDVSGSEASPGSTHTAAPLVESSALAWSLAPCDVACISLLRRSSGLDGLYMPKAVMELVLPHIPAYHGGRVHVVHPDGVDMRDGLEIDDAELLLNIPVNTVLLAMECRVNSSNITRYRVIHDGVHGWISERKRIIGGDDEDLLLTPVSTGSALDAANDLEEMQRGLAAAISALAPPVTALQEAVPSFAAAVSWWTQRVRELGYEADMQEGGLLSSSFSMEAIGSKQSADSEKRAVGESFEEYLELATTMDGDKQWSVEADMQLSELISRCSLRDGSTPQNLSFPSLQAAIRSIDVITSPLLNVNENRVIARAALMRVANQIFAYALPMLSVNLPEEKLRRQYCGADDDIDLMLSDVKRSALPEPELVPGGLQIVRTNSILPPNSPRQTSDTIRTGSFRQEGQLGEASWHPQCTARRLRSLRRLLFTQTKSAFWESVLDLTTTATTLPQEDWDEPREIKTLKINRVKATLGRLASIPHPIERLRVSVLGQLHKEIRTWPNSSFRRSYLAKGHGGQKRAFKVKFVAEGVDDYGGPYRAVFEQIVDELQSDTLIVGRKPSERCLLPLLTPCSNRLAQVGSNQDKFLLSTAPSSPLSQELVQFFGKLTGTAVRQNLNLGLDFSALLWRALVRLPVTRAHLETVDTAVAKLMDDMIRFGTEEEEKFGHTLESIADDADKAAALEMFLSRTPDEWLDLSFSTYLPDGTKVELRPGGENLPITMGNWREFIALLERCRLQESAVMFKAFRDGLSAVLPVELLPLFTPAELEQLVSGTSKVDIGLLRQCTEYEDISPDSPTACNFWRVLEDMTNEERTLFLRFVWARSRMPASAQDLPMNFKLQGASGKAKEFPDQYLPHAQTCFFSLTLPCYSTLEIMREKILYAISNSPNMDADVRITSGEGWSDS